MEDLLQFPGGDLVQAGIRDLERGKRTEEALLVLLAAPRLRGLGLAVPVIEETDTPAEHQLYEALENRLDRGAHAAYNALIGRIVSFANAYSKFGPAR